jgi:hypothetical protein
MQDVLNSLGLKNNKSLLLKHAENQFLLLPTSSIATCRLQSEQLVPSCSVKSGVGRHADEITEYFGPLNRPAVLSQCLAGSGTDRGHTVLLLPCFTLQSLEAI